MTSNRTRKERRSQVKTIRPLSMWSRFIRMRVFRGEAPVSVLRHTFFFGGGGGGEVGETKNKNSVVTECSVQ